MSEQVNILLATYQGEAYIEEQLESILTQTHPNIHLWIRDDGSSDQTKVILQKWAATYPQKLTIIPTKQRLGIKGNFSELMKWSTAPYVMFADQDDKWLPCKVEESLDLLKAMERKYGSHIPLLVHTDLKIVDVHLKNISSSFWRYTGLNPTQTSLNRLVLQNVLTGCTMLMNRSLLEIAYPIPEEAIMHDWWIALVAACFGHIQFLDRPTILYRQHPNNDTGARPYQFWHFLFSKEGRKKNDIHLQTYSQVNYFLKRYHHMMTLDNKAILRAYENLQDLSYLEKAKCVFKHQFFKQGFLRNAKMLLMK